MSYKPVATVTVEFSIDSHMEKVIDTIYKSCTPPDTYTASPEDLFNTLKMLIGEYLEGQMEEADNCTDEEDYWRNDCYDHFALRRIEDEVLDGR